VDIFIERIYFSINTEWGKNFSDLHDCGKKENALCDTQSLWVSEKNDI